MEGKLLEENAQTVEEWYTDLSKASIKLIAKKTIK